MEINLDFSKVNVKKENDQVVLTDVYFDEIVHIEMHDLVELVEFLSRFL